MPQQYDKKVTIDFGRHLATFIHASHTKDQDLAISSLQDVLAEPYRAEHIPGFVAAKINLNELLVIKKKELKKLFNIKIEYLEIRNKKNLKISKSIKNSNIFIAYYFKKIRLIDNF